MALNIALLGRMPYDEALRLQHGLVKARLEERIGDTLLLLEHPPVITLGVRADPAHIYRSDAELAAAGVTVHSISRGGGVTCHNPGQIVGYPLVQLKAYPQGVRAFIQNLEASLIDWLREKHGITAGSRDGKYTGVWVGERKIAAFGLAVQHGVSMHGFALNVNNDLGLFDWINPCGLSLGVTSVAAELGHPVGLDDAFASVARSVAGHLGWTANWVGLAELEAAIGGSGSDGYDG